MWECERNVCEKCESIRNWAHFSYCTNFMLLMPNEVIYSRYRLNPYKESTDEFYLLVNGTLFVPYGSPYLLGTKDYCMETFWNESYPAGLTLPLVCFQQQEEKKSSSTTLVLYATGIYQMKSFCCLRFLLSLRKFSKSLKFLYKLRYWADITCF